MLDKIDHVAIAVRSLEAALKVYGDALGFSNWSIEEVPEQKTRVALLPIGESRIELLEATGPESPIAKFIAKRGEGVHHICFQVDNLVEDLERLRASGMRLINESPQMGADGCRIAFLHPSSTAGVLIELSQPQKPITTNSPSE